MLPVPWTSLLRRRPRCKLRAALWCIFPSKICNKYTNIYGGTKEFRKSLLFQNSKFWNFLLPLFGALGALARLFSKLLISPTHVTSYYIINFISTVSPSPWSGGALPKGLTNSIYTTLACLPMAVLLLLAYMQAFAKNIHISHPHYCSFGCRSAHPWANVRQCWQVLREILYSYSIS